MKEFEPRETSFIGDIKNQFKKFILDSQSISHETKDALLEELGTNFYDDRFTAEQFFQYGIQSAVNTWKCVSLEEMDLWKKTVLNAANHSSEPEVIANNVIKELKKQFTL
jgi:hypothetical protein